MKVHSVAALLSILAVMGTATDGRAVLCKTKKGRLTLREKACKKKEVAVEASDLLFPPGGARVRDSTDKEVGPVVSEYYGSVTVLVSLPAAPDPFSAPVDKLGFQSFFDPVSEFIAYNYANRDCSGQKYSPNGITAYDNTLVIPLTVDSTGTKGYFSPESAQIKNNATDVYRGYFRSSPTMDSGLDCLLGDTPVGGIESCEPGDFCGDTPACFCRRCCDSIPLRPSRLYPVTEVNLGPARVTPPLKIIR